MNHTLDLLDAKTLNALSTGIYAKLADHMREDTTGYSIRDGIEMRVSIERNYLILAQINVQQEILVLKKYDHTPIETKLAKAKIATAKIEAEMAFANLDAALEELKKFRQV